MELRKGDLVAHRHNDKIGYGLILTPIVFGYGSNVCTVQWVLSGYIHMIDASFLKKINSDIK